MTDKSSTDSNAYAAVCDSQSEEKENQRTQTKNGQRRRYYLFESKGMKHTLELERARELEANNMTLCAISGKAPQARKKEDCVRHKDGSYQPKIEFLMDRLGAEVVTRRIREEGYHFLPKGNTRGFRQFVHDWVLEVLGKGNEK